ncbi:hypothetical protein SAMN04488144_13233 [Methylobacterium sp. 190mf]|uniref:hypothetical protein n=1 Tax=Methylobacterium sp. 190mf TaxID=1761798 RepID=UPI00089E1FED|nr:hypothetical protein [Methylobacterium sp. 190mf]SEG64515.1 hypothetical protein SAMN04488144_13233 [Methylobacterium sp. 190mf]
MFESCNAQPWNEASTDVDEVERTKLGFLSNDEDETREQRDRPLTFVRRLGRAHMERLGLLTGDERRDQARAGILAAGVVAHQEEGAVSVSFNSNHYSGRARYSGLGYSYRIVTGVIRELAAAGLITLIKAPVGRNAAKGWQSTYTLTDTALTAIGDPVLEVHPGEPLRMRNGKKRLVSYRETTFTRERRTQLNLVNGMLARLEIGTLNPRITQLSDRWILPNPRPDGRGGLRPLQVRSDARSVHVVHNNEDWDQNGRMTGLFVQQLSKAEREQLTLGGEEVLLLDFRCSHLAIAYAQAGIQLTGDAYAIPGWEDERAFVKRATNTAINCAKGRRQAINAIAHVLAGRAAKPYGGTRQAPEKVRLSKAHRRKAAAVLDVIEAHHAPIREAFYSGKGLRFMRIEADVMLATMLAAIERGIPLLPVYDEFVVRARDAEDVYDLMAAHWRAEVGFEAVIDRPASAIDPAQGAALLQNGTDQGAQACPPCPARVFSLALPTASPLTAPAVAVPPGYPPAT